ncbi:MAG: hypothetical protein GT589_08605 [Peptoclostridium sp.]|uniref:Flp family type IVb pilin n=1 Tax=Peptoclostridium sp. TaxID=1904860 RepID=UPI00139CA80A|nr:hypothetical protein [Peptoclostridium sp.]MZQ76192.1 hypothetical protein [Peptoclostridium sp.]
MIETRKSGFCRFEKEESGQGLIEYEIIVMVIATLVVVAMVLYNDGVAAGFNVIVDGIKLKFGISP